MAINFDAVQNGDLLWDCHKYVCGNTTLRRMGCWQVRIIEKDQRGAKVSWNGNAPQYWGARRISRLRRTPVEVKHDCGVGAR